MTIRLSSLGPFLAVAFINAMVDLGHKIIVQNTIFKIYDDAAQVGLTAIVNALILLPFILLFTPAGYLSDRFAKPGIMRWSAFSAVIVTLFITLSYYQGWFIFAFALTFVLAAQSAIYSPAKYGYIRELAGKTELAPANGFLQATTIVAILSGIFVFTILFESMLSGQKYQNEADIIRLIAPLGWCLVGLSLLELWLAWRLPILLPSQAERRFNWEAYTQGKQLKTNVKLVTTNPIIWFSILGLSLFWALSQTMLAVFPAFAKIVLNEDNTIVIQGLLACSGLGIISGSLLAGKLCRQQIHFPVILVGAIGLISMLFVIPYLNTVIPFALAIIGFGFFGGLFIIPLNALIQMHADIMQLGSVLAANNWVQNLAMISFLMLTYLVAKADTPSALFLQYLPWLAVLLIIPILIKLKRKFV
ncbi:MFS transporter [Methylophaga sp. UBA2689]|uniref:MFS transporter n=1 Tax=Methylophaga sp. UBA2689 TaxID=1946878 RepID=UPI0025F8B796|nr:MFS transporter [Methylophaga sp. UBA2689]|tara:strand:- start:3 stop:1256 length:1254 start_codon:yes stop_codon:yes gene_type:complete